MPQHKRFTVSAVIPVYNGEHFIARTLRSVLSQKRKFDEIIVVDDGSTDRTVAEIKPFLKKGVRLIKSRHAERVVSRNLGWRAAHGTLIAFVDSDLELAPVWLEEILKGFEQGYVAAVDRRAVYQPKSYIAKMNDHFFDLRFTENYKPFTAWVIRKDVLQQFGGLDESAIGFEDINLGDSLAAAGHRIYFAKKAFAYHREPTDFTTELRRHFWFGSHALPYWKKRKPRGKPLKVLVFSLLTLLFFIHPLWTILAFFLAYLYVFLKDLFYYHMYFRYLFVHPFIAVLSEFAYAWGFVYSLFRGPLEYSRSADASSEKKK